MKRIVWKKISYSNSAYLSEENKLYWVLMSACGKPWKDEVTNFVCLPQIKILAVSHWAPIMQTLDWDFVDRVRMDLDCPKYEKQMNCKCRIRIKNGIFCSQNPQNLCTVWNSRWMSCPYSIPPIGCNFCSLIELGSRSGIMRILEAVGEQQRRGKFGVCYIKNVVQWWPELDTGSDVIWQQKSKEWG